MTDPAKAKIILQSDIKNGVSNVFNYVKDNVSNIYAPEVKVQGADDGIKRSFLVTEDVFADGESELVNYKTYYFAVVAYAYNNFIQFDPLDPNKDIQIYHGREYEIVFSFEPIDEKPKISTVTIKTNAANTPNYRLALIGNTGISSVEDSFDDHFEARVISNPDGSSLEVKNRKGINENITVNLYDLNGKLIQEIWNGQLGKNSSIFPINVTSLNSGVYMINLTVDNKKQTLKFIKN